MGVTMDKCKTWMGFGLAYDMDEASQWGYGLVLALAIAWGYGLVLELAVDGVMH